MKTLWLLLIGALALSGCGSEEPDTEAPPPPVIVSPAHGTVVTASEVTVEGSAQTGAWVEVYVDGTDTGSGERAISGDFSIPSVGLGGQGAHAVTAMATDGGGNTSGHSAPVVVYVNLDSPVAAIWSPVDGAVIADSVTDVVGVAEGAASVSLELDGSVYADQSVEAGMFQFTDVELGGDGLHALRARAKDQSGNEGSWSPAVRVTVDASAPSAPEIVWPQNGAYLTTPVVTVRGRAVSGSQVEAYVDSAFTGATAFAVGDTFELTAPLGSEGVKRLTAVAVDSAQNRSGHSMAVILRVDTTEPLPPAIVAPTSGALLSVRSVHVAGIADDGGTVTLWLNGANFADAIAVGWEFEFPSVTLQEGANLLAADVVDLGGRRSAPSDTVRVDVDTISPHLQVDFPIDGYLCPSESVDVRGCSEPYVDLSVDGWPVEVALDGSFESRTGLTPGPNTIRVAAVDSAGNPSCVEITLESYPSDPSLSVYWPPESLFTDSTAITVLGCASIWADVEVEGAAVAQDSTGGFSARVTVSHGVNGIEVVARSPVGLERAVECLVVSDRLPSAPLPTDPPDGDVVEHGRPRLIVSNSYDQDQDSLTYGFFVYYDAALTHVAASAQGVSPGASTTGWTVAPVLPLDGSRYWWRCGVCDGYGTTWSQASTLLVPDIGGNTPHRYLGFGDSITKGSQYWNGNWIPQGLAYEPELEIAIQAFFGTGDVIRRWVDGGTVRDVADSLEGILSTWTPAYCLVHVGTIDCTNSPSGFTQSTLDSLESAFSEIVATCAQRMTLPVLSTVTPLQPGFFQPPELLNVELLNERIRNVADAEDAMLADHYDAFMAFAGGNIDTLLSGDGRHPSDQGCSVMAAEWFRAITGREPGDTEAIRAGEGIGE